MAGDANSQVWLTHALNDDEVAGALTLCFSLKKVLTARKVAVFVSPKVSLPLREALHLGFDFLFYLEEERNTAGLKNEDFAKLSALTLKSFEKIFFLAPTMMALKNSDEIFNECHSEFQRFVWGQEENSSIFMVQSCPQTFKVLMNELRTRNGNSVEQYLRTWTKNQAGEDPALIGTQYCHVLSTRKEFLVEKATSVSMINLVDIPFDVNPESYGLFAKLILERRKMVHDGAVKPLLEHVWEAPSLETLDFIQAPKFHREPLAIVGMSCRYPSAKNVEEFWNLLLNAEDGTGNSPEYRWRREQSPRFFPNCRQTNAGFLKYPVEEFDSKFFGISPKEMVFLDPQHRLLHELVWEGLEDAAVLPESLAGTTGSVFIGSWTADYKDILNQTGNDEFYRMYMGNSIGAAAARISHFLGMTGPSIATESGCSSAMVAVHLACKSLQRGETNFALACGVNLLLYPFNNDLMPMVISPDGHCKTFDANANGFARAEGCGVLVLKRLSDAVRDEDKIWALIRGSGMTQEGVSKSMGTPTVQCESLAMTQALQDARLNPALVSYVEAHGTGTVVGDPMEVAAIAKAYHSPQRTEPLLIGSVKTNVGHTESCSGITGIMKVVLAMQNEVIPAHRNFETLNPAIDLDAVPAKIPLEAMEWKKHGKPRFAGVSSFGITGTDAHAIIEEPPIIPRNGLTIDPSMERPLQIMKITAKTEEALNILLENYKEHLTNNVNDFKDLAYTTTIGRTDFSQRVIIIAKSKEDAIKNIEQNKFTRGEEAQENIGKVCFLFTGQGSQYPGMAKQLYETCPVFRMHFEYCEKILKNKYDIDIAQVLWSTDKSTEVSRTIYSQTSIFCVEYALLKLWESWGVKADYALGHSLGEFAAAVCSGILNVEDALKLVAERSRLIDELPRGKMLVIKADKQKVSTLMNKFAGGERNKMLDYAAINSAEQTVVAGDFEVVLHFAQFCKENNLKCIVLEANHAFHSKHMNPMLAEYRKVAKSVKKRGGNDCKYISGMRGALMEADQVGAKYWVEHTREKVLFMDASKQAVELGCKTFIEIGPQPVLAALTMMNNDQALTCLPSLKRTESEWETLLSTLGKLYVKGVEIDWKGFEQFYNRKKVSLPHYPFIGKKFWPDVLSSTGVSLHPLLGSILPNPSSLKLFQSGLSLRNLEYVKDHAIGDNVIFPGAGFLEMCLAAGLATIEGSTDSLSAPTRPMKIENLSIEAPLCLQESTSTQLQTVVKHNTESGGDWNDINIKIYRKASSESDKWQLHANATFCPLPSVEDKEEFTAEPEGLQKLLETPCEDVEVLKQVYDKLASVGLKFGPNFRSISQLWREENTNASSLMAKIQLPPDSESQSKYILHPVILDAMIQAIMMLRPLSSMKKTLYVPIKIGKFVWLSTSEASSSELYIRAIEQGPTASALLMDSNGAVLAGMSSVELIDTTVKAIESVLEQQNSVLPDFWEETWRKLPHHPEFIFDEQLSLSRFYTPEQHTEFERQFNNPGKDRKEIFQNVEQLSYLHYICTLRELGWKPAVGQCFEESTLFSELGIKPNFRQYFTFICDVLEEEGILQKISDQEWKIIKNPPTADKASALLASSTFSTTLCAQWEPTKLYQKVGENLTNFFKGEVSPLSILFPEGPKKYPNLNDFYLHYGQAFHVTEFAPISQLQANHLTNSQPSPGFTIRILEVGAGTGSFSEFFLELFDKLLENGSRYEYTYTDISAAFFPAAEKRFEKQLQNLVFKKLNLEEDPIAQGFTPGYFDLVFAAEVIHATRDIGEALRNIRLLMKPFGKLVIQESTRVNRVLAFLFGTLEGYWRFQDFELRPKFCTLDKKTWKKVLIENGYGVDGIFSVFEDYASLLFVQKTVAPTQLIKGGKSWLVFHDPKEPLAAHLVEKIEEVAGRPVIGVTSGDGFKQEGSSFVLKKTEIGDFSKLFTTLKERGVEIEGIVYCWALGNNGESPDELLHPYFNVTKTILTLNLKVMPRMSLILKDVVPFEESEMSSFATSTVWGFNKSMKNENFYVNTRCIAIADGDMGTEFRLRQLFQEIWSTDKENQVAFNGDFRYIPKFQPYKPLLNALKLPPGSDRFQLVLPDSKSISDLQFGPLEHGSLKEDEVEVQIKASALNFRDVLSVIKPSDDFKDVNTVGFDFAGMVKRVGSKVTKWNVGDRVCGCNVHFTAMPSHVVLGEDLVLHLPDKVSYSEGATMPAVYMTSVLCLMEVAKIKKEDLVLIHTATGGVGLSAIEICKSVGCEIIATAGSKRKQNYLRSLGIEHIFHSRNTKYGDHILELTNGRGVDVVLNSLTGEGFKEATLKACAKGARFIEMSKLNIWSEEDVKKLRPDVHYTAIDLSQSDRLEWGRLIASVRSLMEQGVIKPIPYLRFDALHVREGLQFLQKAKHIGKIVCIMPELRHEDGKMIPFTPMFNEKSTYLITGGLGGIGFVVCQWMLGSGAKHVILGSRNPPNSTTQRRIDELNSKGANVLPVQLDVANFEQLQNLIQNQLMAWKLPPLKGVMHAAGTLSDGLIVNLDWSKLSSTFSTKIQGSLNLHELTKDLNLEHFILFSSVASHIGPPGQSNHAAGNAFEDALAHYRHSIGLPATTINWGQWGEVGVAKEIDVVGINNISNLQGIAGLEYVMKTQRTQTAVVNVESFVMLSKVSPQVAIYVDERVWNASMGASTSTLIKSDEFWQQYDSFLSLDEKTGLLKLQLQTILRNVLKLDSREEVGGDTNLQEMGVDSLMFVEIKNSLQILMGDRLVVNAGAIKDCNTMNLLATTLINLIEGTVEEEDQSPPTQEEVNQLILEDCQLPEEIAAKPGQKAKNIREVSRVLLTGATGLLGPYILKELVSLSQISEVVCLIRPRKNEGVEDRLRKALESKSLHSLDTTKVRCVSGNVSEPRLGLEENVWEELSLNIDAVFNCAASVLHTEHYRKRASTKDTRAVNVGGIRNILEFATQKNLKLVYHASSLLAVNTVEEDGRISERWPEMGEYDNVTTLGYPVSKYVGDMLMKEGAARGIPTKIFRFPLIVGEKETGRCTLENNHALLRFMFIVKNGVIPSTPQPWPSLPVDDCARVSIRLFFDERATSIEVFNCTPAQPDTDQDFVEIAARFGHTVDIVEFSEFTKKIQKAGEKEGEALGLFKDFYSDESNIMNVFTSAAILRKWLEGGDEASELWRCGNVVNLIPDYFEMQEGSMDYFYRDLNYCKSQGWFIKFGL